MCRSRTAWPSRSTASLRGSSASCGASDSAISRPTTRWRFASTASRRSTSRRSRPSATRTSTPTRWSPSASTASRPPTSAPSTRAPAAASRPTTSRNPHLREGRREGESMTTPARIPDDSPHPGGLLLLALARASARRRRTTEGARHRGPLAARLQHDGSIQLHAQAPDRRPRHWNCRARQLPRQRLPGSRRGRPAPTDVPASFQMVRDAGTIAFEGQARSRPAAAGRFTFTPNPEYLAALGSPWATGRPTRTSSFRCRPRRQPQVHPRDSRSSATSAFRWTTWSRCASMAPAPSSSGS